MEGLDADLIAAVASGDQAAFGELYHRHAGGVYTYCLRLVQDASAAQDIVQDAFVSVWQGGARGFRRDASVKTWLFSIAHHRAVSWLRRQRRTVQWSDAIEDIVEEDGELDRMLLERLDAREFSAAMASLSPQHRAVIELTFAENMSYQEVAQVLACPVGTVKSRMNAAVHALNGYLARYR